MCPIAFPKNFEKKIKNENRSFKVNEVCFWSFYCKLLLARLITHRQNIQENKVRFFQLCKTLKVELKLKKTFGAIDVIEYRNS